MCERMREQTLVANHVTALARLIHYQKVNHLIGPDVCCCVLVCAKLVGRCQASHFKAAWLLLEDMHFMQYHGMRGVGSSHAVAQG